MKHQARTIRSTVLADQRQVKVIVSTESLGRDNLILETAGVDLTAYRTNPVVLWQHDPCQPIATALDITATGGNLEATVQFPPEGASPKADEIYALIRAGVVNAASSGFETLDATPFRNEAGSGLRVTKCELQEFSFCSIPAVPDALIMERSNRAHRSRNAGKMRRKRMAELYAAEQRAVGKSEKPSKHQRMAALYAKELARK